jgi:signal transduction histidine kinase
MHDVIAHSLTVMIAVSDGARLAADENPQQAKEAIGRVAETGRRTLSEVRRLLGTVRDGESASTVEPALAGAREAQPQHAPQPDAGRLPALVQEFADAGLPVRMTLSGRPPADAALGLTVYRIVQESLTNSLRHATDLQSVEVHVDWLADEVGIVVQDTSASPPASVITETVGRGLLGMQERAALYNGMIEAGPQDLGWRVAARLHWDSSEGNEA